MRKSIFGLSLAAIVSFLASLLLCGVLISVAIINEINIEKLQLEQFILENSVQLNEVMSRLSSKTQSLSALVIQGDGDVKDFDKIAPTIIAEDPAILNVFIAPDGIISKIYPLEENEAAIGWNFFGEGSENKAAVMARDTGNFTLSGPFDTPVSGKILIGKLPVYMDTPAEKHQFWGLVSVTLQFPHILSNAEPGIFSAHDLIYELWRINPDTAEKQVIIRSDEHANPKMDFVERNLHITNAEWYLKVWLTHMWYNLPDFYILVAAGFLTSILVLVVVQNNSELRRMKVIFEEMSKIDPVTGIFNRRYMDDNLKRIIKSLSRSQGTLSLLMIDVDLFKNYNDTYGHSKGDICLKVITEVIKKNLLRADDFVARYGGEEFVVVLPNTGENGARKVADRLLESVRERNITHEASSIASYITISIGATTGFVQHTYTGDDYIKQADKAMYISKKNGRNRYTFLNLI
ncbi:MAG: sensor domain-containing diguanylate cyclase [Treponema sp.]|nr:sensor domain-containing diguanylate cyclase [Treponema sp.]